MLDILTTEIREQGREDIKRKNVESHVIICQDMIIGSSIFLPALTTARTGFGHLGNILHAATNIYDYFCATDRPI